MIGKNVMLWERPATVCVLRLELRRKVMQADAGGVDYLKTGGRALPGKASGKAN